MSKRRRPRRDPLHHADLLLNHQPHIRERLLNFIFLLRNQPIYVLFLHRGRHSAVLVKHASVHQHLQNGLFVEYMHPGDYLLETDGLCETDGAVHPEGKHGFGGVVDVGDKRETSSRTR